MSDSCFQLSEQIQRIIKSYMSCHLSIKYHFRSFLWFGDLGYETFYSNCATLAVSLYMNGYQTRNRYCMGGMWVEDFKDGGVVCVRG